jgi:hypothetical protein
MINEVKTTYNAQNASKARQQRSLEYMQVWSEWVRDKDQQQQQLVYWHAPMHYTPFLSTKQWHASQMSNQIVLQAHALMQHTAQQSSAHTLLQAPEPRARTPEHSTAHQSQPQQRQAPPQRNMLCMHAGCHASAQQLQHALAETPHSVQPMQQRRPAVPMPTTICTASAPPAQAVDDPSPLHRRGNTPNAIHTPHRLFQTFNCADSPVQTHAKPCIDAGAMNPALMQLTCTARHTHISRQRTMLTGVPYQPI